MKYSLGKKIKILRKNLGYTQEDLSCEILSRSILCKIENDKVTPSIYQLKYLSTKLLVTTDFLLNDKEINLLESTNIIDNTKLYSLYSSNLFIDIIILYESEKITTCKNIENNFYIGYAYFKLNNYTNSMKLIKRYINSFEKLNIDSQKIQTDFFIKSINILTSIYYSKNNIKNAIKYNLKGKLYLESINLKNTDNYTKIINNLGLFYNKINDYNSCISISDNYLSLYKTHVNIELISNIYINLNIAYYNLDKYAEAIDSIKTSMFFYKYSNNLYEYKECFINYINCFRYNDNFKKSFNILSQFKNRYFENIEKELKGAFLILEAILYFNINDYLNCDKILSSINITHLDRYNRNTYDFIKGHISYVNNDYNKSKFLLNRCTNYFIDNHYFYDLSLLYYDLYKITEDTKYISKFNNARLRNDIRKNVLYKNIDNPIF